MQPKTAIIILIILAILGLSFIGYLYYYTQKIPFTPANIINNKQSKEIKKELSPKEKKQQMTEFLQKPSAKTPAEQAETKKKMIEFLQK